MLRKGGNEFKTCKNPGGDPGIKKLIFLRFLIFYDGEMKLGSSSRNKKLGTSLLLGRKKEEAATVATRVVGTY